MSSRGRSAGSPTTSPRVDSYGLHAKANYAGKKIGVIYQNDDYGKDYLYGFRAALGKKYADANVVAQEAVEPTATSSAAQITRIKAAGAQILAVFQLPTPTVRSIATAKALGLNLDQIYMNNVAAIKPATDGMVAAAGAAYVNGLITIQYAKDPQDPEVGERPRYEAATGRSSPSTAAARTRTTRRCSTAWRRPMRSSRRCTRPAATSPRQGLMNALLSLNTKSSYLLPGIVMKTSKTDHFVISQMQLARLNSTTKLYVPFGKLDRGSPALEASPCM